MAKKSRSKRSAKFTEIFILIIMTLIIVFAAYGIVHILVTPISSPTETLYQLPTQPKSTEAPTEPPTEAPTFPVEYPVKDEGTMELAPAVRSPYAILIDLDNNHVIAEKGSDTVIYPASMTKLMTLIVAIEHTQDFNDTFLMTEEILQPLYDADASMAGFSAGEACTIIDMLYGAALPSGADATTGLAIYTAGSEEAFVEMMNEKAAELGLTKTHFMNASGLHDPQHYSTVTEMAMILEYCMKNDLCREVISTYTYTTQPTEQHPEGIELRDTMFDRMYGTEVEGITILGGKTGYTDDAGHCLANYARTPDGHTYVAVMAKAADVWYPIFDSFRLYGIITGTYEMGEPPSEDAPNEGMQDDLQQGNFE